MTIQNQQSPPNGAVRPSHASVYIATAARVAALLTGRPEIVDVPVPACPEWTIGDVGEHLCDVWSGRLGSGPPVGTALDVQLEWWARTAAESGPGLLKPGEVPGRPVVSDPVNRLVVDVVTHELDLHRALGLPVPDGDPAYEPGYVLVLALTSVALGISLGRRGLPDLVLVTPKSGSQRVGRHGGAAPTVRAGRHDMLRSLTGRRTEAQIAALDWSEDATRWLPAFQWGPFFPPARPTE